MPTRHCVWGGWGQRSGASWTVPATSGIHKVRPNFRCAQFGTWAKPWCVGGFRPANLGIGPCNAQCGLASRIGHDTAEAHQSGGRGVGGEGEWVGPPNALVELGCRLFVPPRTRVGPAQNRREVGTPPCGITAAHCRCCSGFVSQ